RLRCRRLLLKTRRVLFNRIAATMRAATKTPPQAKSTEAKVPMKVIHRKRIRNTGSHCQRLNRHREACACPASEDTAPRGERTDNHCRFQERSPRRIGSQPAQRGRRETFHDRLITAKYPTGRCGRWRLGE